MTRGLFRKVLFPFYLLLCGEIIMRVIAAVTVIPDIELLVYARDMTRPSAIPGLTSEHVPSAKATLMGRAMTFDGRGNRNPGLTEPKAKNERRLYFMGTSIMLGWGVGDDETLAAGVENRLTAAKSPQTGLRYRSINAGVAGFNIAKEVTLFRHQMAAVKPDAVIMQYYLRDSELGEETTDTALLQYTYLGAFLYQYGRGLRAGEAGSVEDHYRALHRDGQPGWEQTKRAVRQLKALCEQYDIALAVLIIPDMRNPAADGPFAPVYDGVREFFSGLAIPVIDPHNAVRRYVGDAPRKGWVHSADPHPNAAVHGILGRAVYDFLDRNPAFL